MLRWLILILVLLNLGLFTWGYLQPQPQEDLPPPLPDGAPTIRMLSEREQPSPTTAAEDREEPGSRTREGSAAEPESAGTLPDSVPPTVVVESANSVDPGQVLRETEHPTRCLRLGPFEQWATATNALAGLSAAGHEVRQQVKIEHRQSGYWVLIPPGIEDPEFVIASLELVGIQDSWHFGEGELAGAVSLGLFSDKKQAMVRQAELKEKGFYAEIRSRQVEQSVYWIESTYVRGDAAAEAAIEQVYVEHSWLGFPPPECAEVATP